MARRDKSDRAKREPTPGGATGGAGIGSAAVPPDSPGSDQGGIVGSGKVWQHGTAPPAENPETQAEGQNAPEWLSEYPVQEDGRVRPDMLVIAMSEDSFPCSDPPSFTPGPIGAPAR